VVNRTCYYAPGPLRSFLFPRKTTEKGARPEPPFFLSPPPLADRIQGDLQRQPPVLLFLLFFSPLVDSSGRVPSAPGTEILHLGSCWFRSPPAPPPFSPFFLAQLGSKQWTPRCVSGVLLPRTHSSPSFPLFSLFFLFSSGGVRGVNCRPEIVQSAMTLKSKQIFVSLLPPPFSLFGQG